MMMKMMKNDDERDKKLRISKNGMKKTSGSQ